MRYIEILFYLRYAVLPYGLVSCFRSAGRRIGPTDDEARPLCPGDRGLGDVPPLLPLIPYGDASGVSSGY